MSRQELAPQVKDLIVRRLKLDIDPKTIDDGGPALRRGPRPRLDRRPRARPRARAGVPHQGRGRRGGRQGLRLGRRALRLHRAEEDGLMAAAALPHAYPFRFVDAVVERARRGLLPRLGPRPDHGQRPRRRWARGGRARCSTPRRSPRRRSCSRAATRIWRAPGSSRASRSSSPSGCRCAGETLDISVRLAAHFGADLPLRRRGPFGRGAGRARQRSRAQGRRRGRGGELRAKP